MVCVSLAPGHVTSAAQTALAAFIPARMVSPDIPHALKMLQRGLHQLRGRPQPGSQHAGLEGATGSNLGKQLLKHGYNPRSTAK